MSQQQNHSSELRQSTRRRWSNWRYQMAHNFPVLALCIAGIVCYWNSFDGDFIFDDVSEIRDNPSIRTLWPPQIAMFTARDVPTRPIPYYSFAINYALHETELSGYHFVNLCIHLTNAVLIFLIVRSTLALPSMPDWVQCNNSLIAFSSALLWVVHPLNTEAVTYIYQRIESMMAMFFLLTFYFFIRAEGSSRRVMWLVASVATAAIGMACKEVMAVIPAVIALYDYAFFRKNIRVLILANWRYYFTLVSTWSILIGSMWGQLNRYGNNSHTAWQHLLTQPRVIFHYLRLSFFPIGQSLDLGWRPTTDLYSAQPEFVIVLLAVVAIAFSYARYPGKVFVVCFFFVVLSPTSSFVPVADLADEYRMYLPLAAITTGFSIALAFMLRLILRPWKSSNSASWGRFALLSMVTVGSVALGTKTVQRNSLYHDKLDIWKDTVEQSPDNPRAHVSYAIVCLERSMTETALEHCLKAIILDSDYPLAELNLGIALLKLGRPEDAVGHLHRSISIENASWLCLAENNLGLALVKLGRTQEAVTHLLRAIEINPELADAYLNLGNAMRQQSEAKAISMYRKAIEINPKYSEAYNNLGLMLAKTAPDEAHAFFEKAIHFDAGNANAYCSMGILFTRRGNIDEAIRCYRQALAIDPNLGQAKHNLDIVLSTRQQNP